MTRKILKAIAFPFILLLSIIRAIFAKPFRLRASDDGLEIGVVPIVIIFLILNDISGSLILEILILFLLASKDNKTVLTGDNVVDESP
jgi:hypothetical protein